MPRRRAVPLSTWLTLLGGLALTGAGVGMAREPGTRTEGVLVAAFFALCSLAVALDLARRRREDGRRRPAAPSAAALARMAALERELTPDELARRRPVWSALSELFLDTELQPSDHVWIARRLRDSGYSDATLRRILVDEVAPACGGNLMSLVGEWAGFDERWLEERIREALTAPLPGRWLARRGLRFALGATKRDRAAIQAALVRLRQAPAALAARLADAGVAAPARAAAAAELAFLAEDARPVAPALRAAASADPAPEVRAAAVAALWRAERLDALDALLAALGDPDAPVRRAAVDALAAAALVHERIRGRPAPPVPPSAVGAAAALLRERDAGARAAAAAALGTLAVLGAGAAVDAVAGALDERDEKVRVALAQALERAGAGEARLGGVVDALRDGPADRRRTAAQVLALAARREGAAAGWLLAPLLAAAREPDLAVRRHAVTALGWLGAAAAGARPLLAGELAASDPELRGAALGALARVEAALGAPPLARLLAALEGKDEALRRAASSALYALGAGTAPLAPRLEALARSRDLDARVSAKVLLDRIRESRAAGDQR